MPHDPFSGAAADSYAAGPLRQVPGFASLHRMVAMLLSERMPADGRLLVLGAGGGLELEAFAALEPGWSFDGVDPSADMLAVAERRVAAHTDRVRLTTGYAADAPEGPFDGATALLTFHFIAPDARRATLAELRRRLKPGAPLVVAHLSFPQTEPERSRWIARHVAFGAPHGTDPATLEAARAAIAGRLSILSPEDDVALLAAAGFAEISLFYAGLSVRGWVGYAA